jgi:hypothetical protein
MKNFKFNQKVEKNPVVKLILNGKDMKDLFNFHFTEIAYP